MMDCPCATLDDAMAELDRLRQTVEMLTVRVERLTVQARKAGLIPVETLDTDNLSAIDLGRVLGLSRQRVYKLSTLPGFPAQIAPGKWSVSEVLKWREHYRATTERYIMGRRRIMLTNDFHGSHVELRADHNSLSRAQVERARKTLCGVTGCTCGGVAGERGPQEWAGVRFTLIPRADGGADIENE